MLKYPAIIHKGKDGFYLEFLDVDIFPEGDTLEEAVKEAEEMLAFHLGGLFEDNWAIPQPTKPKGKNIIYIDVLPHVAVPIMLREIRKKKGLSQTDVADKLKTKYQNYQQFENIKKGNLRIKSLENIARVLDLKLEINFVPKM